MAGLLDDPGGSTSSGGSSGGSSDGGDGGGILSRIVGLLGAGVSGGDAGIATLGADQEAAADRRALMNFGIAMMASAGPHYGAPRSAGQIIASGLAAGEASRTASETAAASAQKTAFQQRLDTAKEDLAQTLGTGNLDVARGGLDVSRGELSLKAQELALKQQQFAALRAAGASLLGVLGGGAPASGGPVAPVAPGGGGAAAGDPAWLTAIGPAPAPTADAATFKDAAVRDKIIAVAKAEGVDPNVALAYALRESSGDPAVQPGDGGRSRGLFQIGKSEAASVGVANPDDPEQNILAGVRYIKSLQNDPKYGANDATTLLAYAAGKGAADSVLAGQRPAPAVIAQHVANLRAVQAQNPAGVPPPAQGQAGTPAPGDPGYTPTGMRTSIVAPASAAPGPGGTAAPTGQPSIASLPPELQAVFRARAQAAMASGDPSAMEGVMADLTKTATELANRPRVRIMSETEAQQKIPPKAYDPTAIYAIDDTTGKPEVIQQGKPPVPFDQTPQGRGLAVAQQVSDARLKAMSTTAQQADSNLPDLTLMRSLSSAAGPANQVFEQYPKLRAWLTTGNIGTPEQIQKWTAGQALDAIANRMALDMKPTGIQRLTDFDLQRLLQSVPTMGDTPASRELKIAILQSAANRRIQENAFAQDYIQRPPYNTAGLDAAMSKELGPAIPHAPRGNDPAQHRQFLQGLADGDLFIGPDGKPRIYAAAPGQ